MRIDDLIEKLLRARAAGALDVCVDVTRVTSDCCDCDLPLVRDASVINSIAADGARHTTVVLWLDVDA